MNAELTAADLRRILRVGEAGLRSYLRAALIPISPSPPGRYSFQDLVLLRTAQGLKEGESLCDGFAPSCYPCSDSWERGGRCRA